jgi:DNA-binding XRE family transcriptional regulator
VNPTNQSTSKTAIDSLPSFLERRRLRQEAGFSLQDAGDFCGVSRMTVSRWERDQHPGADIVGTYVRFLLKCALEIERRRGGR